MPQKRLSLAFVDTPLFEHRLCSTQSVALPPSASEIIDKHFAAIEKQVSDRKAADETLKTLVLSNVHSCNDTSRIDFSVEQAIAFVGLTSRIVLVDGAGTRRYVTFAKIAALVLQVLLKNAAQILKSEAVSHVSCRIVISACGFVYRHGRNCQCPA
jgi:hypothetical protein